MLLTLTRVRDLGQHCGGLPQLLPTIVVCIRKQQPVALSIVEQMEGQSIPMRATQITGFLLRLHIRKRILARRHLSYVIPYKQVLSLARNRSGIRHKLFLQINAKVILDQCQFIHTFRAKQHLSANVCRLAQPLR